ncbi:MAG: hypothetical protein ACREJC_04980 [Tepidisphaeraceae bacterium]
MKFQKGNKLAKGGRRPGAGRRPLAVREACAQAFEQRIPLLSRIADTADRAVDKIAALNLLAKIGLPTQVENVGGAPCAVIFTLPPLD